jgi:preprotein translocase subunit SecY
MKKFFSKNKKLICMLLFTAFALLVWRLGVKIKVPLFSLDAEASNATNLFGFLDIFTGGALSQFSILALGISPYITASIVIQLLQMDIVPQFKEWAEEGEAGKAKLNQWTRYLALFLAFVQSLALIIGIRNSSANFYFEDLIDNFGPFTYVYMSLVMTAGTAFVMWLADQITLHGVGNGGSMMIVAGIVAGLPAMFVNLYNEFIVNGMAEAVKAGESGVWSIVKFCVIVLVFLVIIVAIVWMEGLQRKIPVQYANRPAAAALRGKQDSNVPLKLNSASVIPVIFASTLLSVPLTVISFINSDATWLTWLKAIFNHQQPIGFALYIILIFLFSFFYSFLQINPEKMAENLKKQNAYIPGVKPGEDTAAYISKVLFKVTLLGATYLAIIASIPMIVTLVFNITSSDVSVLGTSIMIVVGVAIETAKQIKTQVQSQEYHGFM